MSAASTPLAPAFEEPFNPHWMNKFSFNLLELFLFTSQGLIGWAVYCGHYWVAVPLVLIASHFMHGFLIAFHEATHGLLRTNRRLNEIDGILLGLLSFMSFSLYRTAHQTHHAHLGAERDEELWPFVETSTPRWARRLAAFVELNFGLFFTPALFMRTFFRKGSPIRSRKVRRRIWMELAGMALFWTTTVALVHAFGVWKYFLWIYFLPAFIAGNLQSWRKYIEHVGLTGATIRSATRSIVADGWIGKLVSYTLLHEPYHGIHHQQPGLPHAELPGHVQALTPTEPDEHPPFPSYWHALRHLLGQLQDPRVGAQWKTVPQES